MLVAPVKYNTNLDGPEWVTPSTLKQITSLIKNMRNKREERSMLVGLGIITCPWSKAAAVRYHAVYVVIRRPRKDQIL